MPDEIRIYDMETQIEYWEWEKRFDAYKRDMLRFTASLDKEDLKPHHTLKPKTDEKETEDTGGS